MWNNQIGKEIARILYLVADPPNLRRGTSPDEFDLMFDGGGIIASEGLTVYKFADGTEAFCGSGTNVSLTIKFPTGEKVTVDVTPARCRRCGEEMEGGMKYCSGCGEQAEPRR